MSKLTKEGLIRCLVSKFDKKFQYEVSQIAKKKFSIATLLGGLSVNLNHLRSQTAGLGRFTN